MDFALPEEYMQLKKMVRKFTEKELFPLENIVIEREASRGFTDLAVLPPEEEIKLMAKTRNWVFGGLMCPKSSEGRAWEPWPK